MFKFFAFVLAPQNYNSNLNNPNNYWTFEQLLMHFQTKLVVFPNISVHFSKTTHQKSHNSWNNKVGTPVVDVPTRIKSSEWFQIHYNSGIIHRR